MNSTSYRLITIATMLLSVHFEALGSECPSSTMPGMPWLITTAALVGTTAKLAFRYARNQTQQRRSQLPPGVISVRANRGRYWTQSLPLCICHANGSTSSPALNVEPFNATDKVMTCVDPMRTIIMMHLGDRVKVTEVEQTGVIHDWRFNAPLGAETVIERGPDGQPFAHTKRPIIAKKAQSVPAPRSKSARRTCRCRCAIL